MFLVIEPLPLSVSGSHPPTQWWVELKVSHSVLTPETNPYFPVVVSWFFSWKPVLRAWPYTRLFVAGKGLQMFAISCHQIRQKDGTHTAIKIVAIYI